MSIYKEIKLGLQQAIEYNAKHLKAQKTTLTYHKSDVRPKGAKRYERRKQKRNS